MFLSPGQKPKLATSCEEASRVTAFAPGIGGARGPEKGRRSGVHEVELDLEAAALVRDEPCGESARGDAVGHVPPVVARRRERKPDLADDLGVEVQRLLRGPPGRERQGGQSRLHGRGGSGGKGG